MIVPSVDIQGGRAVQLEGGRELKIDGGDPAAWVERFRVAGEVAVIDLDAAAGRGDNRAAIEALVRRARCRVGGGIRDREAALRWLDAGAEKVILGTAATPELLAQLPRGRAVAALDAVDGEVMVDGWRTRTGRRLEDRLLELAPFVDRFLVTFIEREGRMGGVDPERLAAIAKLVPRARVTFAGGVTTADDVALVDRLGADAQVGMALYAGRLDLGDAVFAPCRSDRPDGLVPTVVADEHGRTLGLAHSTRESVREAVRTGRGVYHSRRRGLWRKGDTSGDAQELVEIRPDCDRDALLFVVRQRGRGHCHLGATGCFGELGALAALARELEGRREVAPPGSYTARLLGDDALLASKLAEEAAELAGATAPAEVVWEAADLFYFTLVKLARAGVRLADVEAELDRRARRVRRRGGEAKPPRGAPGAPSPSAGAPARDDGGPAARGDGPGGEGRS
jgi:phosphoribosylformimino-5-aminoimidazole carboxamide ribotide isomerase